MSMPFAKPALRPQVAARSRPTPDGHVDPEAGLVAILTDRTRSRSLGPWVREHAAALESLLRASGGLLLRGFVVETPQQFRDAVLGFGQAPLPYLERAAARTEVAPGVFTSTEFSSDSAIDLHHELSFAQRIPERIFFYANTLAATGGSTPVADERRCTARLDPAILRTFAQRDVLYVRNYRPEIDMDWRAAFQTQDRGEVEAYCRANGIACHWLGPEHLRTEQRQKAFVREPGTDRHLFCNHAHMFHSAALSPVLVGALVEAYGPDQLPRNVRFGDGSPIPDDMVHQIRAVHQECLRSFEWQRHDVLVLDNARCLHGRAPFTGQRTTLVSMTNLISRRA